MFIYISIHSVKKNELRINQKADFSAVSPVHWSNVLLFMNVSACYNCLPTAAPDLLLWSLSQLLQPTNLRYREGQQYSLLQHIQNGSYGDVFSAVDHNTGFKCAAKKVRLQVLLQYIGLYDCSLSFTARG